MRRRPRAGGATLYALEFVETDEALGAMEWMNHYREELDHLLDEAAIERTTALRCSPRSC
jgi:hypothetical protein